MNKSKGFTIIELIVVIAIIAVLAAIVLVNVTQYISKSRNAGIQSNLSVLQTNAASYFEANSGVFGSGFTADTTGCGLNGANASPGTTNISKSIYTENSSAALNCWGSATTQAWCATAVTNAVGATAASTWCVDSTGYAGTLGSGKCVTAVFTCQ